MKLYDYLYAQNIRKYLLQHRKNFAVLGHLHKSWIEKDFRVIKPFHDECIYEDETTIAISDAHLGLYDYTSDELDRLRSFLERQDKKIILLGDFFDLFYAKPSELSSKYADLIGLIKRQQRESHLVYVHGNHDWNVTLSLGIPSVSNYSLGRIIYLHGHECDPYYTVFPLNLVQKIRTWLGYRLHWLRCLYLKFNP
ncbi:MAG: metallophosphoesterase [Patescibacteria group bacterium]